MNDVKSNHNADKFYNILRSVDIEVEEADVYYRRKYNDIMNYLKMILTHNENSLLYDYSKIVIPKGLLLVNINPNSDIHAFLDLISKNYYLDVIEMNYEEIYWKNSEFFENFQEIMLDIINLKNNTAIRGVSNGDSSEENLNVSIKKMLIIDENQIKFNSDESKNLLEIFINSKLNKINFIENNCILIWIADKINNISRNSQRIFDLFDLFINIPPLDRSERESVLKHFSELFPKIVFDVETIANYTNLWEVNDFKHLLKLGIINHYLKSELNQKSNEITDVLIELIETKEFIPSINSKIQANYQKIYEKNLTQLSDKGILEGMEVRAYENLKAYRKEIQEENISDFMRNQLYEHAASKHYKELQIIIDKIIKHEVLEENDRLILAKYPFVLNEKPQKALISLEKAKKKINRINQMYKGT